MAEAKPVSGTLSLPPKTLGRRKLRFRTLDEILADARSLTGRPVAQLGNWSLGQICRHLASGMRLSIDGQHLMSKWPWWLRLVGPLFKYYVLWFGLSPGYKLKGEPARHLVPDPVDTAGGLSELEAAVRRLRTEPQRNPRHVFGRFTREQWDRYHMRHAELHLSFIVPLSST